MANQDVIKYGETFYLRHQSGQYLIPVDRGRYNWPQLGNRGKVKLQIVGGKGEVTSNSYIKIRTTESVTGNNDILGAFSDSHNCYYWRDGYDDGEQGRRITKASGSGGPIHYGDRVLLTNISYRNDNEPTNRRMIVELKLNFKGDIEPETLITDLFADGKSVFSDCNIGEINRVGFD